MPRLRFYIIQKLFSARIFVTKETVWRLILFNFRKTAYRRIKAVVIAIVITLANLTKKHCTTALLHFKIMIEILRDINTFSRGKTDLCSRLYDVRPSICVYRYIRVIINLFIRKAVVHADKDIAAAAVDDILPSCTSENDSEHTDLLLNKEAFRHIPSDICPPSDGFRFVS